MLCLKYLYIVAAYIWTRMCISTLPLSLRGYILLPSRICINGIKFKNVSAGAMIFSISFRRYSRPFNLTSIWTRAGFSRAKIELKSQNGSHVRYAQLTGECAYPYDLIVHWLRAFQNYWKFRNLFSVFPFKCAF